MYPLTDEQIQALKAIDTPTVCNAIEKFKVRGRVQGFMGMDIRCLLPELGTMVGYAVTVTVDSTTEGAPLDTQAWFNWMKAMEVSPKPVVVVFKDIGPTPRKSAHLGEVMATIAARLRRGQRGDRRQALRDIVEVKQVRLQCFAQRPGGLSRHGGPRLIEVGVPVTVDSVTIEPGDLRTATPTG
jgi:regulator of RNase E activity RraA